MPAMGETIVPAEQRSDERRLADARPPHDRQGNVPRLLGFFLGKRVLLRCGLPFRQRGRRPHSRRDRRLHVVDAFAVLGGGAVDLGEAERPRFGLAFAALLAVDLVRHDDSVAAGFANGARRRPIAGQHPRRGVDHEQHHVGALNRGDGFLPHGPRDVLAALGVVSARVEERVSPAVRKPRLDLEDVPRDSRQVVNEGAPPPREAIGEGGLSDVGPPGDDDPEGLHFFAGALRTPPTRRSEKRGCWKGCTSGNLVKIHPAKISVPFSATAMRAAGFDSSTPDEVMTS